jgi:F420-dependent NADP oxidoreductase-like protein
VAAGDLAELTTTTHVDAEAHYERLTATTTSDTTVAIIGTGNIGRRLAANFAGGGQDFLLAGRDQDAARTITSNLDKHAEVVSVDEAVERADTWSSLRHVVRRNPVRGLARRWLGVQVDHLGRERGLPSRTGESELVREGRSWL